MPNKTDNKAIVKAGSNRNNYKLTVFLLLVIAAVVTTIVAAQYYRYFFIDTSASQVSEIINTNDTEISAKSEQNNFSVTEDNSLDQSKNYSEDKNSEPLTEVTETKRTHFDASLVTLQSLNKEESNESKIGSHLEQQKYISLMIIKFLQDQDFTEELTYARKIKLPLEYGVFLDALEKYNKLLNSANFQNTKIFPADYSVLENIIKIEKISSDQNKKELLKKEINKKLNLFINYVYSQEFQRELN